MEIIFHAHHAPLSDRMRTRAERGVRKLAGRIGGTVGATVRFEQDGPMKRVEIVLLAPRHRRFVAESSGRFFGNALTETLQKLSHQVERERARQDRSRAAEPRVMEA
jgi:ribosome-associated translation inhibitor RaiA